MRKNILVLSHSASIGGAELALASLIESTKHEFDWHLVIADSKKAATKLTEHASRVDYLELPWWCYEAHDLPRKVSRKILEKNIKRLEHFASSADYLLTNTITIPWLGFIAGKVQKPHVWYVHEFGDIDHNLQFVLGYQQSLEAISGCSNRVLTISSAVKEHLMQVIPESKIELIHQAIDINRLLDIPVSPNDATKPIKLLCMGAIKPSKGQHVAIQAAQLLKDKFSFTLDVVGPSANGQYLEDLLAFESPQIHIQPRAYDIVDELSTHDICLICSDNEAMGRVTLECLAAGRKVVGYGCKATKELLDKGRGIIYEPNTPKALAQAIEKSISIGVSSANNRAFVQKTYSAQRQANDLTACITNADEAPSLHPHDILATYLAALETNGLFYGRLGNTPQQIKKIASNRLPKPAKKLVKKILRKPGV